MRSVLRCTLLGPSGPRANSHYHASRLPSHYLVVPILVDRISSRIPTLTFHRDNHTHPFAHSAKSFLVEFRFFYNLRCVSITFHKITRTLSTLIMYKDNKYFIFKHSKFCKI